MIDSLRSISINNVTLRKPNNHLTEIPPRLLPPSNIKLWCRTRTHSDEVF